MGHHRGLNKSFEFPAIFFLGSAIRTPSLLKTLRTELLAF